MLDDNGKLPFAVRQCYFLHCTHSLYLADLRSPESAVSAAFRGLEPEFDRVDGFVVCINTSARNVECERGHVRSRWPSLLLVLNGRCWRTSYCWVRWARNGYIRYLRDRRSRLGRERLRLLRRVVYLLLLKHLLRRRCGRCIVNDSRPRVIRAVRTAT